MRKQMYVSYMWQGRQHSCATTIKQVQGLINYSSICIQVKPSISKILLIAGKIYFE